MKRSYLFYIFSFLFFISCTQVYRPSGVKWQDYRIKGGRNDSAMLQLLRPYSDNINRTMNNVLAQIAQPMDKKQPEGPLGDLMADAMLDMARKKFNMPVHAAFINNGGIRITNLPAGPITTGKVYEIMPFDNVLILQHMSGAAFKTLLNHIAKRGGWPSAGVSFTITGATNQETATNILVGGQPLDERATYTVANSDYIANGGDDCEMLKTIPQINKNVLLRDAFIEYFTLMGRSGKAITAPPGNRIQIQQ